VNPYPSHTRSYLFSLHIYLKINRFLIHNQTIIKKPERVGLLVYKYCEKVRIRLRECYINLFQNSVTNIKQKIQFFSVRIIRFSSNHLTIRTKADEFIIADNRAEICNRALGSSLSINELYLMHEATDEPGLVAEQSFQVGGYINSAPHSLAHLFAQIIPLVFFCSLTCDFDIWFYIYKFINASCVWFWKKNKFN
jgi:hypothetical protein